MTLREQLLEMAEPAYRDFTMPLMPGVEHVIGIRVPKLRLLAREIVRGDWRSYLDTAEDLYFEEQIVCPFERQDVRDHRRDVFAFVVGGDDDELAHC